MNTTISNALKQTVMIASAVFVVGLMFGEVEIVRKDYSGSTPEASYFPPAELATIRTAAIRNGIQPGSENWRILLAIRKAENGPKNNEFGIMNPKANDLDSQAGWCAASIVKGRQRWIDAGKPEDFITHFGRRYCPPSAHELNKNWVKNVTGWATILGTK